MDGNSVVEKEKQNKKISLVIMIVLCALFGILGVLGGVLKFLDFVNNMNPVENEVVDDKCQFRKGNTLTFCQGDNVVYTYNCQFNSCGWAYGYFETPKDVYLDVPKTNVYQFNSLIDGNYAIIYDGDAEEGDSYFRNAGVKIIPIHKEAKDIVTDIKALNNYNVNNTSNRSNTTFIAKNNGEKWGVINLANDGIKQIVPYKYDYIGSFVPHGETFNEQTYYAALDGDKWYIIEIGESEDKGGSEIASNSISSPIIAFDLKSIITRENNGAYTLRNFAGEELLGSIKNYYYTGYGLLCVYDNTTITIYDTFTLEVKETRTFPQITDVKFDVKDNGTVDFTLNGTTISIQGKKYPKTGCSLFK